MELSSPGRVPFLKGENPRHRSVLKEINHLAISHFAVAGVVTLPRRLQIVGA